METNSSGEDLFIKTRKPYTITKQREKWTEEEHNKFIEALKLYGRAWQRIEEHIGTKTAVQIRSHAQKFFTKLEKEALMKGIPSGQDHEIEIPPPRPKRKPTGPYPRKTGTGSFYSRVESMTAKASKSHCPPSACNPNTEMEDGAPTKTQGTEDNSEDGSRSEVLNHFKAAPSASVSSLNNGPSNTGAFKGFVPLLKGIRENTAKDSTSRGVSKDLKGSDIPHRSDDVEEVKEIQTFCQQEDQSFSKHVPMELSKGNSGKNIENTDSGISSIYNPLPSNHDTFSSFSSHVVSSLMQNPAVHAAATLAASFWPSAGTDILVDPTSQTSVGGIPDHSHMNPSPSMAAIAAATVAAASAWWATQGLLQLFHPPHPALAFAPAPTMDTVEVPRERMDEDDDPERLKTDKSKSTANGGFQDSDKATSNKKLDRSSCGSNTTSSSEEVEIDVLEKQNEDDDRFNSIPAEDTNSKRVRSFGSINESWKEVSQGGRIAFKALFTRGVLPQSFSPTQMGDPTVNTDQDREAVIELPVDLNVKACESEKLKVCRTGFKPYKRCSEESKESRSGTGEESGNKRIRLEGETLVACNVSPCFRTS